MTGVGLFALWTILGRWAFLEVTDPWDAEHLIRARFLGVTPAELRPR